MPNRLKPSIARRLGTRLAGPSTVAARAGSGPEGASSTRPFFPSDSGECNRGQSGATFVDFEQPPARVD